MLLIDFSHSVHEFSVQVNVYMQSNPLHVEVFFVILHLLHKAEPIKRK